MTEISAGQTAVLLSQWRQYENGPLTDLDTTPTIQITAISDGASALPATTAGVTHPGTGSYGYAWTPAAGLTPGLYLALWTGLASGAPVTATETVTVLAAPMAEPTAADPRPVWYATREEIKAELDVRETARSNARVDRALDDASRAVEGLCHRRFWPWQGERRFDWPDSQNRTPWRLWLDEHELIALTSVTSAGTDIDPADMVLYPQSGPPFSRIEINLGTSATWGGGATHQQDISLTGLWAGCPLIETNAGALTQTLDLDMASIRVDAAASAAVGVGSLLRIDQERVIVTGRSQVDTGQSLGGDLGNINSAVTITVQDGGQFAAGETILIDGERLRVDDVAGDTLVVTRAWDGSTIAAHSSGTPVYAPRALAVERAAAGTSAATHSSGNTVWVWQPPGPVRQLCIAEALTDLLQGRSGYARTAGSGESERETSGRGLADLRARVYASHGRKARTRAV
ncbi:hypothetical protein [Streptomyces fumanus]|uniref:Uncharacterized protein n=1 Tax=Streptomyces fumanus TaxID=67302 RepID=A0A919A4L1_9ACTN|nr:hypothetical protein [Streptomyces fumanus]GHE85061.1 hypothetical protein GCM10018772_05270 [Streptomyces fumanus]